MRGRLAGAAGGHLFFLLRLAAASISAKAPPVLAMAIVARGGAIVLNRSSRRHR